MNKSNKKSRASRSNLEEEDRVLVDVLEAAEAQLGRPPVGRARLQQQTRQLDAVPKRANKTLDIKSKWNLKWKLDRVGTCSDASKAGLRKLMWTELTLNVAPSNTWRAAERILRSVRCKIVTRVKYLVGESVLAAAGQRGTGRPGTGRRLPRRHGARLHHHVHLVQILRNKKQKGTKGTKRTTQ